MEEKVIRCDFDMQCDVLRPLRLPAVLVGDARLGGISATIAAYELLRGRGYDVAAIVMLEAGLQVIV